MDFDGKCEATDPALPLSWKEVPPVCRFNRVHQHHPPPRYFHLASVRAGVCAFAATGERKPMPMARCRGWCVAGVFLLGTWAGLDAAYAQPKPLPPKAEETL